MQYLNPMNVFTSCKSITWSQRRNSRSSSPSCPWESTNRTWHHRTTFPWYRTLTLPLPERGSPPPPATAAAPPAAPAAAPSAAATAPAGAAAHGAPAGASACARATAYPPSKIHKVLAIVLCAWPLLWWEISDAVLVVRIGDMIGHATQNSVKSARVRTIVTLL